MKNAPARIFDRSHLAPRVGVLLLAFFIAWNGIKITDEYYRLFELAFLPQIQDLGGSDFPAFYGGTELFLESPGDAYDGEAQGRAIAEAKSRPREDSGSPWERYYNPPFYSLLFAPLTLFDLHTAYGISFIVNAAGLGLLLGVLYRLLEGHRVMFAFFAAGLIVSQPVNYAFWHGQPTLFLAAILGFVYLQRDSMRNGWSGLSWTLLVIKPQWLALPLLGQASFTRRQLVAAAAGLAVLALPFVIVGPQGTWDYVNLLLGRGGSDLQDEAFAEAVLSWTGFVRGLTGEARVEMTLGLSALTLLYYVMIRRRGNDDILPLAGAATFLLIVPHAHPQDWILLAPGAAILLRSHANVLQITVTTLLLVAVCAGITNWSALTDRRGVIYWPTVACFGLLVWSYVLSEMPYHRVKLAKVPSPTLGKGMLPESVGGD